MMDEEIEDIIGDVKCTDSQKSVAASNVYSMDFTDSSSDKNNSSGKETYVLEQCDSEESDSYPMQDDKSIIFIKNFSKPIPQIRDAEVQCEDNCKLCKTVSTSVPNCSIVVEEIYTQTSKTIIELAQAAVDREHIDTQKSLITITENTMQYRIKYKNSKKKLENSGKICEVNNSNYVQSLLDYESSRQPVSDSDTIKSDDISEDSSDDRVIYIINDPSNETILREKNVDANSDSNITDKYDTENDFEGSNNSDMEEDSLMEAVHQKSKTGNNSETSDVPQSVDDEVEELYNKLSGTIDIQIECSYEPERQLNTLTPLTEESTIKRDSLLDLTPTNNLVSADSSDKEVLFTNNAGVKIKMWEHNDQDTFKLPPIHISNRSPDCPHLDFLFSVQTPNNALTKAPSLYVDNTRNDRWEINSANLGSGESPHISGRNEPLQGKDIHLPPIHSEGYVVNRKISKNDITKTVKINLNDNKESINIQERIQELKHCHKSSKPRSRYIARADSRSGSPGSDFRDEGRLCEVAEKGCEVLCVELVKRLRSASWFDVADTLEDIPNVLDKFWGVIAEYRVADLIRQITAHVESPRTHLARAACASLAAVIKNTNYTKKPDFYEAVTVLLTKTGSFCHPVRRAANVALDDIVCGVELTHAVTALCVHGIEHKSPLVRCASARLLVVCTALAEGGRGVLRVRPPSAAAARALALRALSALLDDKSTDARKYAERLYAMLRPLPNFEAYFLTDVGVEPATRQMKKYDKLTSRQAKASSRP